MHGYLGYMVLEEYKREKIRDTDKRACNFKEEQMSKR